MNVAGQSVGAGNLRLGQATVSQSVKRVKDSSWLEIDFHSSSRSFLSFEGLERRLEPRRLTLQL